MPFVGQPYHKNNSSSSSSLSHFGIFIANKEGVYQLSLRILPKKKIEQLNVQTCMHKALCLILSVTYPGFFWADRLHLGVPPSPFRQDGWQKFLNLVPPDALKMHSLAVPVLRFLCKTFSKLHKLNNETLLSVDV